MQLERIGDTGHGFVTNFNIKLLKTYGLNLKSIEI